MTCMQQVCNACILYWDYAFIFKPRRVHAIYTEQMTKMTGISFRVVFGCIRDLAEHSEMCIHGKWYESLHAVGQSRHSL